MIVMTKIPTNPYKGTRDFYPEDFRKREYIFNTWKQVLAKYGYEQYDTPLIEPVDLYKMKNQSNQEIVSEQLYDFEDKGGRRVALRPEMTPSISRIVAAKRQELPYPYRVFSIPNLWRYERPQKGRLREHWQLNVDVFGLGSPHAELEILQISKDFMQSFGADSSMYEIRVNSRKIIDSLIAGLGEEIDSKKVIALIDRKHKMSEEDFMNQLDTLINKVDKNTVLSYLGAASTEELPESCKNADETFMQILNTAKKRELPVVYDPTLVRGFDYYTGFVFEVFDTSEENNRAMFGGGRYDGLVGSFGVEPVDVVGFGKGDVVIADFLDTYDLWPELKASAEILVVSLEQDEAVNHAVSIIVGYMSLLIILIVNYPNYSLLLKSLV
jgi:histidyl-tRNA synthetase